MRYSKWYNQEYCKSCNIELSWWEVMHSDGRCPYCGVKGPRAGTIVDTREKAVRKVYHRPWYIFWQKPTIETKDN